VTVTLWLVHKCGRHIFSFSSSLSLYETGCGNALGFANPRWRNAFQWVRCIRVQCSRFLGHWTTTLKFLEVAECEELFQAIFFCIPVCGVTMTKANNNFMVEPLRKWPLRIRKYLKSYSVSFAKVDMVGVSNDFVCPPMFRRILSVLRGTVYRSLEHGHNWPNLLLLLRAVMHCVT